MDAAVECYNWHVNASLDWDYHQGDVNVSVLAISKHHDQQMVPPRWICKSWITRGFLATLLDFVAAGLYFKDLQIPSKTLIISSSGRLSSIPSFSSSSGFFSMKTAKKTSPVSLEPEEEKNLSISLKELQEKTNFKLISSVITGMIGSYFCLLTKWVQFCCVTACQRSSYP